MPKPVKLEEELSLDQVKTISVSCRLFCDKFGDEDAQRVLDAGSHSRDRSRGEDYFVDCLAIAIAYECFSTFNADHGFSSSAELYMAWISEMIESETISFEPYLDMKASHVLSYIKKFKSSNFLREI